jgi:hypothetical protein
VTACNVPSAAVPRVALLLTRAHSFLLRGRYHRLYLLTLTLMNLLDLVPLLRWRQG